MANPTAYYFKKPQTTDVVRDILADTQRDTQSILELRLERVFNYGRLFKNSSPLAEFRDSLRGHFRNSGLYVAFIVPPARDDENRFEGIEFDKFDLQEFNDDGNLEKYVSEFIKAIDKSYKKRASQKSRPFLK